MNTTLSYKRAARGGGCIQSSPACRTANMSSKPNARTNWMSPARARERRRELQRERKRRQRERERQLARERGSDSEEEQNHSLDFLRAPLTETTPRNEGDRQREAPAGFMPRPLFTPTLSSHSDEITTTAFEEGFDTLPATPAPPDRPPEGHDNTSGMQSHDQGDNLQELQSHDSEKEEENIEKLAREFALIKCGSLVSDAAIEKLFHMFAEHRHLITSMIDNGEISKSYKNTIKPTCVKNIPPILLGYCAHKTKTGSDNSEMVIKRGLKKFTNQLLYTKKPFKKVLWHEGYVRLRDIVNLHIEKHRKRGTSSQCMEKILTNATFSIDGMPESKKGSRKLIVATIRFGTCIYLWRVLRPLVNDPEAKPDAEVLLR